METTKPEIRLCIGNCGRLAEGAHLCGPCADRLYLKLVGTLHCHVCGTEYSHDVARVNRQLLNPRAPLDHTVPRLCWICARLHHATRQENDSEA